MEKLDLTSFRIAINSLESIINRYEAEHDTDIRDAVIQRFEYTYSLALKMITQYINMNSSEPSIDMTFNEIIRKANQYGLLKSNLENWTEFRQKRNMTSHTYDENVANLVVQVIPEFKEEVVFLLNKLEH